MHIIIPVYNSWPQTRQCLEALRRSRCQDFRIVIVDHSPNDETTNHLTSDYPEVTRIAVPESLWWAGATNIGIEYAMSAGATHVILLNNDSYPEPDCIGTLLSNYDSQEQPRVIAPKLTDNATHEPMAAAGHSCFALGFPTLILHPRRYNKIGGTSSLIPCHLIMGARGVIIPTAVFTRVGLFDAACLPHYWADHDFYLRCNRAGIPLFIDSSVTVRVDNTRTTIAKDLANMSLSQFKLTLRERRSHRNVQDLMQIFRKHYPVPGLHGIGVVLNLGRYTLIYLTARITRVLRCWPTLRS